MNGKIIHRSDYIFRVHLWKKIEVSNLKTWYLNYMSNSDVFV
jgi:hypothetical protein